MSRPLRILELRSVRGTGGGPEKTILFGAKRADPARYAVTVCYIRDRRDDGFLMDGRASDLGVDYVEIPESHSFDPSVWPALRALVRERQIDLVHAHEYKTNFLTWLLAKREPVIPLSTIHGWFGRDTWRERLYYGADKRILASFPRLIAVSTPLKEELVRTGSRPEAVTVVPNGIDETRFVRRPAEREPMRRELGIQSEEVVVGAVGRLERQKRFDLLMRAFAELRARHPHLRLLIAGDGGLGPELRRLRDELGLGDDCRLLGHQPDISRLHHAFDLFVQASDDEGSPNVVLEAMAMETPIVATDVGGTADILLDGRDGLIVPPGDLQRLTAAIDRCLTDFSSAHTRAVAARRRVEAELSFERRMARVERIYDEMADGMPASRRGTHRGPASQRTSS